jgi:hypothetical protein
MPRSSTVGGYIVTPAEGITSASSTFKLPSKATCTDSNGAAVLLGLDVPGSGGGDDAWAQVAIGCGVNGVMTVGSPSGTVANADASLGDRVETRIVETPGGATIATVDDLTKGQVITSNGTINSADSQVILGSEILSTGDGTLEKFSSPVAFSGVEVGGLDWSQTSPAPSPFALVLTGSKPQIVPSKVPAKASSTFTLTENATS